MCKKKHRYTMDVTPEFKQEFDELAALSGVAKSEVFRRAMALFKVSCREIRKGNHIGSVKDEKKLDKEFLVI